MIIKTYLDCPILTNHWFFKCMTFTETVVILTKFSLLAASEVENFWRSQWRKFRQNDDSFSTVMTNTSGSCIQSGISLTTVYQRTADI